MASGPIRAKSDSFVAVPGYADWVRGLRKVAPELERAIKAENKEVAEEVASEARRAAGSHSAQYDKAAAGIRARGRSRAAAVALLVRKYPWLMGAEFGAKQFRQFKAWTGNQWQPTVGPGRGVGYVVYPTIRRLTPQIVDDYADRVERRVAAAWNNTATVGILEDLKQTVGASTSPR